ncbi:hypothetical protein F0365_12605 [Nonlabens sp. Ci31]|jgi:hypothetical protein|uniref:hypothetical protein n=1 Tax=Nonlabens sp. Ci31 TaxID=2608253 RepID=UPI0014629AEB|nr:hypothetical protein [Nonlabens sp. Ci31]QJP35168.1 hypothetical protein F0365_12605 [Nonlabens sp. Ci31]
MTVKDLFRLVFKSIGVICLFYSFISLFGLIGPLMDSGDASSLFVFGAAVLLVIIAIYLVFFIFVDKLITQLKLDKGFDNQQVNFGTINTGKVFEVILFTLGMINIINVLPDFIHWFFKKFQKEVSHQSTDIFSGMTSYDLTYDLIYFGVGLSVILLRKQIVKLLQ